MTDTEIFDWLMAGAEEVLAPAHVPEELGPCLESGMCKNSSGYAGFGYKGKMVAAHRWVFKHVHKHNPHVVRHICDNPACISEYHLLGGAKLDNSRDAVKRGRTARGERSNTAKLTEFQVRRIREEYAKGGVSQRELGRRYGVDHTTIGHIVRGNKWKHVEAV